MLPVGDAGGRPFGRGPDVIASLTFFCLLLLVFAVQLFLVPGVVFIPSGLAFVPGSLFGGVELAAAVPVIDTAGRMVNASQITFANNNWMSITKVDDWWGDRILIEQSLRPTGPFRVVGEIAAVPKCAVDCNTYFASWIPSPDSALLMYGLSHNRWDGVATGVYRPTFASIPAPARILLPADRCSLGLCG